MIAALALLAGAGGAMADCRNIAFDANPYTICEVTAAQDLRLFHSGKDGAVLGSFGRVDAALAPEAKRLTFAMNAGMYHADRAPVGLLVVGGVEISSLVTQSGPGNFGLLPNGVFCIADSGFAVIESRDFAAARPGCRHATQSGPMLVINGKLHPRFIEGSDSRYIRNGIGVSADGKRAVLAISGRAVNFWDFGRLFRDHLELPNALYFDGKISRLYAPALRRDDFGFQMGPIIGLVEPR